MLAQAIYDVGCGCILARKRGNLRTGRCRTCLNVIEGVVLVIGVLHPINDRVVNITRAPNGCEGDILSKLVSEKIRATCNSIERSAFVVPTLKFVTHTGRIARFIAIVTCLNELRLHVCAAHTFKNHPMPRLDVRIKVNVL